MHRSLRLFLILFLFPFAVTGQDKLLTLQEAVSSKLRPKTPAQWHWSDDSESFSYVEKNSLMKRTPKGEPVEWITLPELNKQMGESMKTFPEIKWMDDHRFSFIQGEKLWVCDLQGQTTRIAATLFPGAENIEVSPALHLAFTHKYNLYLHKKDGEKPYAITFDGNREVVYGEPAHRVEFGIQNGAYWSPAGDKLAFYRMDQRMVTD